MRPPGLSHAEYKDWLDAQTSTHQQRIRVRVTNLNHRVLEEITDLVVDGDVHIDTTAEVTRKLALTLADPSSTIGWEPSGVVTAPRYGSRMLQVDVATRVPALGRWVEVPVFIGPVVDFDRAGAEVNITCEGKERLALGNFPHTRTFRRKSRIVWVIQRMLRLTGETRISMPNLRATLPEDITVTRMDQPWVEAQKLARSINRVLFYDATGRVRLVERPRTPLLTIPPEWLTGPVSVDRQDVSSSPNRWIVLGPKPKGGKRRVSADISIPARHPLAQVRNGERIWRMERIERNGIKSRRRARQIGLSRREDVLSNRSDFAIECLNLPHLSEFDRIRVVDPYVGGFMVRVFKASLPLDGSPMTLGTHRRRRTTRQQRRSRARRKAA